MKKIFIWILILLMFVGFGAAVYIVLTVSKNDIPINITQKDLLIKTLDENGKPISVNVTIMVNDSIELAVETRNDSYQKIGVPIQHTKFNVVSRDNRYYSDENYFIGTGVVFTVRLNKVGDMEITHVGNLTSTGGKITLNVSTNQTNRELSICVRWSGNIIEVNNFQYPRVRLLTNQLDCEQSGYIWHEAVETCNFACKIKLKKTNITEAFCDIPFINLLPPDRLINKIDRCWYVKKTITPNDGLLFDLDYRSYDIDNTDLTHDYIKVYILDSDKDLKARYRFQDDLGNDIAAKDVEYQINETLVV